MSRLDQYAKKISVRTWGDIRDAWLDYIPKYKSPWPIPDSEFFELPSLQAELKQFSFPHKSDVRVETIEHEIDGLRIAVLHEAVILIHKAANVLRATDAESARGYRTWSRSSAYHSAFFAMRGILGILGIVIAASGDRKQDFQVDIWAERLKKPVEPHMSKFATRIIPRNTVQHKELWSMFHRILCANRIEAGVWSYAGKDILKRLDIADFSFVRHRLHYRSTGWLYSDLSDNSHVENLESLASDLLLPTLANPDEGCFPLALALQILSLGVALLTDLGREVPKVQAEANRVKAWMRQSVWGEGNLFEQNARGDAG